MWQHRLPINVSGREPSTNETTNSRITIHIWNPIRSSNESSLLLLLYPQFPGLDKDLQRRQDLIIQFTSVRNAPIR